MSRTGSDQQPRLQLAVERLQQELLSGAESDKQISRWVQSLLNLAELAASTGARGAADLASNFAANLSAGGDTSLTSLNEMLDQILSALNSSESAEPSESVLNGMAQDPELLADFILESREHLSAIEQHLLDLEKGPGTNESVHAIFRGFHTIKGLAGFLEFALIQTVAHEVENLLDSVRQGFLSVTPAVIDAVLEGRDYVGRWLTLLETDPAGKVPSELKQTSGLISRVRACASNPGQQTEPVLVSQHAVEPPVSESPGSPAPKPESKPEEAVEAKVTEPVRGEATPAEAARTEPARAGAANNLRSIKVNTDKLDYLVDMVGELVIAQSLVRTGMESAGIQNQQLSRNLAQLARITNEVQRTAMAMRMVPIGSLFQKMARLVRDLGRKFGKAIEFETEGEEVELDRNIVEELADPLMHMVRNAVDHGIEPAEERQKKGKPVPARLQLRAFHRAGQIIIEVADNGRGIDRDRVLAKAVDKGLISRGAVLSDNECFNLIFHPGFSTAENVSDISGRGVGMDVVRKQITRLRGTIDIASAPGRGTTFSLKLPLTLAIIDGLVVIVGAERFIIPIASVRELLRPKPEMLATIENRAEVVSIRDQVLPLIRLHERFGVTPRSTDPSECVLVVADTDTSSFCLMVDEMAGKQEVVIKSLGRVFRQVRGVAGGAILGDGQVGLILDLKDLFGAHKNG